MAHSDTSSNLGDDFVDESKNPVEGNHSLSNIEKQHPDIPQHDPEESVVHDSQSMSIDAQQISPKERPYEQGPEPELTERESPLQADDTTSHQSSESGSNQSIVDISLKDDSEITDLHGWENHDEFRIWANRFGKNQLDMEDSKNEELKEFEEIDEWEGNTEFSLWMERYRASRTPNTEVEEAKDADEAKSVRKTDEEDKNKEKSNEDTDYNELEEDANDEKTETGNGEADGESTGTDNKDANDEEIVVESTPEEVKEYKDPLRDDDAELDISVTLKSSCLFDEGWVDNENHSQSEAEWKRQKEEHGQENEYLDKIMSMVGLEEVKAHFLMVKASVEAAKRRDHDRYVVNEKKDDEGKDQDVKNIMLNILLVGNMGTGTYTHLLFLTSFLKLQSH